MAGDWWKTKGTKLILYKVTYNKQNQVRKGNGVDFLRRHDDRGCFFVSAAFFGNKSENATDCLTSSAWTLIESQPFRPVIAFVVGSGLSRVVQYFLS